MTRFLSPEWLDQLAAALDTAPPRPQTEGRGSTGGSTGLSVRHVVTGGPDGVASFVLRSADGSVTLDGQADDRADVEVHQDFTTAVEIATGKLSPSAAFAAGRIKLTGHVGLLVDHQGVLASLGDPFVVLRSITTY